MIRVYYAYVYIPAWGRHEMYPISAYSEAEVREQLATCYVDIVINRIELIG